MKLFNLCLNIILHPLFLNLPLFLLLHLFLRLLLHTYYKLQIVMSVIIPSPVPLIKSLAKFSLSFVPSLNLLQILIRLLFSLIFLTLIYRTLQSLLHLHSTDLQNSTLSTIHVNDFLKKFILLEPPPQLTSR